MNPVRSPPGDGSDAARYSRAAVSLQERSELDRMADERARYVARGVTTPALVVSRAEGAVIWDATGREFLDFAGGIGCLNLGHGHPKVRAAIHAQVDRYLHQC